MSLKSSQACQEKPFLNLTAAQPDTAEGVWSPGLQAARFVYNLRTTARSGRKQLLVSAELLCYFCSRRGALTEGLSGIALH